VATDLKILKGIPYNNSVNSDRLFRCAPKAAGYAERWTFPGEKRETCSGNGYEVMIFKKFLSAILRDWGSRVTGVASVPLTIAAFWANTPTQRILWAAFALACFGYASFRIWVAEYRRAETAEAKLKSNPHPWVAVDDYDGVYEEDAGTGKEALFETLRIVNRGDAPAVNIEISPIQFTNRTARLLTSLQTLAPGESTNAQIINLRYILEGVQTKTPKVIGRSWSVRIPLTVKYRDLNHTQWETKHAVLYNATGISFSIVNPNEPLEWSPGIDGKA
jgi:hypothetical protein